MEFTMALPITGPTYKSVNPNRYYYKQWDEYKQAKPFNKVLPYWMRSCNIVVWTQPDPPSPSLAPLYADGNMTTWSIVGHAQSKAYDRLKDKLFNTAQLGASMAEGRQSLSMIATRGLQVLTLMDLVRRRNVSGITQFIKENVLTGSNRRLSSAQTKKINSVRSRSRDFAANFLEIHFGWVPMVQDIHDACDVLSKPFTSLRVTASAKASSAGSFPVTSDARTLTSYKDEAVVRYGALVTVENPNLLLANRLGLINPASVLWEVVPFSFVADWFTNVGQFLGSMTDFCGLAVTEAYTTKHVKSRLDYYKRLQYDPYNRVWYGDWRESYVRVNTTRGTGIATPSLQFRPLKLPGLTRAITQVSLLIQLGIKSH